MGKLRTPSKHVFQRHQRATEANQQRPTDRLPPDVNVDRSAGDLKVGAMAT